MLDIHLSDWVLKDQQTNNMLLLSCYDGRIQVKVRPAEKGAQPLINRRLSMYHTQFVTKVAQKIMAGSPETKIPLKWQSFDKQSKQWRLDWVMTFEKDSKMCYRIHITDAQSNQTHVFNVKGRQDISVGADIMSESDRSAAMMHDLLFWIEQARRWCPAYTLPYDPNKKNQWKGKNGQGGFQRQGGYGGGGGWKNNNGGGGWKNNNGGGYGGGNNGGGNGGGAPSNPSPSPMPDDDSGLPF